MSIIRKPEITRLFQDRSELMVPRVHNKHHNTAPADAVYVGRGSPWGNPYMIHALRPRAVAIELFRTNVLPHLDVTPLRGKHLVCFCKPLACHGDLLFEAANK